MMDADKLTVQKHFSELDVALIEARIPKIDPTTDAIARLIPRWSIETWILFLDQNGADNPLVSEDRPCKNSKTPEQWSELIPNASDTLYKWTKTVTARPKNLLDSLQCALQEIPRALPRSSNP